MPQKNHISQGPLVIFLQMKSLSYCRNWPTISACQSQLLKLYLVSLTLYLSFSAKTLISCTQVINFKQQSKLLYFNCTTCYSCLITKLNLDRQSLIERFKISFEDICCMVKPLGIIQIQLFIILLYQNDRKKLFSL